MNAPQGSEAWLLARCGRATASRFADVMAKGEGKTKTKYLRQVLCERLTGKPVETFSNGHTERGQLQEPLAREAYEIVTGALIEVPEFIPHPSLMAGCSPDGLIDSDGGGEFKCVIPTVQLETILRGKYPPEHRAQIQGNLWITERSWWDFASFCPDMPGHLRLYVFRVTRDEEYIATIEKEVRAFLREVDDAYDKLMARSPVVQAMGDSNHACTQA